MAVRARWIAAAAAAVGLGSVAALLPRYLRAASVLSSNAGIPDPTGMTRWVEGELRRESTTLQVGARSVPVRVYRPLAPSPRGAIVLIHGIHPDGIDESRLTAFAAALARIGYLVWTPSLPELAALSATAETVRCIRAAGDTLTERSGERVIGIGISVGGGLLLQAASHAPQPGPFQRVMALGAHHDLSRVARHYAGDVARDPDGAPTGVSPHPYGLWVLAHAHVERLFEAPDVEPARAVIGAWIDEDVGSPAARGARLELLSDDGRVLVEDLRSVPVGAVLRGRLLGAIAEVRKDLDAVSPVGHLQALQDTEVLLLHGADDPVVPPTELQWLAAEVPARIASRSLVTPVLGHAEFPEGIPVREHLSLLHFVAQLLR